MLKTMLAESLHHRKHLYVRPLTKLISSIYMTCITWVPTYTQLLHATYSSMHQHLSIVSKVSSQFILSTLNSEKLKIGGKKQRNKQRESTLDFKYSWQAFTVKFKCNKKKITECSKPASNCGKTNGDWKLNSKNSIGLISPAKNWKSE